MSNLVYGRVYGLSHPTTGEIRYVGQTRTPLERRLSAHLAPSSLSSRDHRSHWIRSLKTQGLRPVIQLLAEAFSKEELDRLEVEWITKIPNLTNLEPGGNSHSPEHYQRLATIKRGVPRSLETKAKISAARAGQPSPKRGIPMSEAQKVKVSASRIGKLLGSSHHQFRDDISTDLILQRLRGGLTKVQVAEELGVAPTFVHRRINQAKREGSSVPPRGKQIPQEAFTLRAQGMTLRAISARFSIGLATLCRAFKEAV